MDNSSRISSFVLWSLVITILLAVTPEAFAGFYQGHDLAKWMVQFDKAQAGGSRDTDYEDAWRFKTYVIAVVDATEDDYNFPDKVRESQLCTIVSNFMKENPKLWHLKASDIVRRALKKAFPF